MKIVLHEITIAELTKGYKTTKKAVCAAMMEN